MTDPVSASFALIVPATELIIKLFAAVYRNTGTRSRKAKLSDLNDTIMKIEPSVKAMKESRDKDPAVSKWFDALDAYLNTAKRILEECKTGYQKEHQKKITKLTNDIEKHLKSANLPILVQNEKILEEQRKIKEALAYSSGFADTAKAAHTPIGIMNCKKISRDGPPGYESTLTQIVELMTGYGTQDFVSHGVKEEYRTENQRIGTVLHDYAALSVDELNLTAGEEVHIIFEEDGWLFVLKDDPGRDGKMGFVPMPCVSSS